MKILAGLLSFVLGTFLALILSLAVTSPRGDCPSPCDSPAYAAMGLFMLLGPVLGLVFGVLGYRAFSRYLARKSLPSA